MKKFSKEILQDRRDALVSDETRLSLFQNTSIFLLVGTTGLVMTIINLFSQQYRLAWMTLGFGVACLIDLLLLHIRKVPVKVPMALFAVELTVLFLVFIITGVPDGFSVIWTAMLPSFGLLMFGMRYGTIISLFMFLALVFFFWIPFGQGLLQYHYDATFMLRFPLLYLAFFAVAFLLERMRELSHKALIESREKYEFLCYHDALTGLYNRFWLQTVQTHPEKYHIKPAAIGILDIDNFKFINDNFGHPSGDIVIQRMGQSITNTLHGSGDLCRWGGDEFLILFHTDIDAETVCKRIVDEVRACEFIFEGERTGTTVSVGLAIAPSGSTDDIDALIHQADVNLYLAKDEGKNCTISSELKA
ncbi:MAG: diguanylate cyclase [Ruminococcus sp.]|nr:diguanylate cyclase [Ruminococcus sp.]